MHFSNIHKLKIHILKSNKMPDCKEEFTILSEINIPISFILTSNQMDGSETEYTSLNSEKIIIKNKNKYESIQDTTIELYEDDVLIDSTK